MLWISTASGMIEILLKSWSATIAVSLAPTITFLPQLTAAIGKPGPPIETLHFASAITKVTDFFILRSRFEKL